MNEFSSVSLEYLGAYPQVYKIRAQSYFFGIAMSSIGAVVLCLFIISNPSVIPITITSFFVFYGAWMSFYSYKYLFIIDLDKIETRSPLRNRSLRHDNIAGKRTTYTGAATIRVVLVPKDDRSKELIFTVEWDSDAIFDQWLASLPDLDEVDFQAKLADPKFGETREIRAARMEKARLVAIALTSMTVALCIGAVFLSKAHPEYFSLLFSTLAALPIAEIFIFITFNGMFTINQSAFRHIIHENNFRKGVTPNIAVAILAPISLMGMWVLGSTDNMIDLRLASQVFIAGAVAATLILQWVRNHASLPAELLVWAAIWGGCVVFFAISYSTTKFP